MIYVIILNHIVNHFKPLWKKDSIYLIDNIEVINWNIYQIVIREKKVCFTFGTIINYIGIDLSRFAKYKFEFVGINKEY